MSSTVRAITEKTNTEAALLGLAKATDRARALEHEADCVFDDLTKAQERCAEVRIDATVNLTAGVQAAYSAWKQDRAKDAGREIARQDHGWPIRDPRTIEIPRAS